MTAELATNLFQDAKNGDKSSREFWLKTRGRWSFARPPEDEDKEKLKRSVLEKVMDSL
jgi:hypothetical protein